MKTLPIKVLIVDDSFTMRLLVSDLLASEPMIEIMDPIKSGEEAILKLPFLKPDCIILDINMPGMDGLSTLQTIMKKYPTPVIMLTGFSKHEIDISYHCLFLGAVGFIEKPSGEFSLDIDKIKFELISKIKIAVNFSQHLIREQPLYPAQKNNLNTYTEKIIVMGSSMGGPETVEAILTTLPADSSVPIFVVQHIPNEQFLKSLVDRLNKKCWINLKIIENDEPFMPGSAYYVPPGYYATLKSSTALNPIFGLEEDPLTQNSPSIDSTMISLAQHYHHNIIGIILSGMGNDGLAGMKKIKSAGGKTIAQNEEAFVYGMPKIIKEHGLADQVLSLESISRTMVEFLNNERF